MSNIPQALSLPERLDLIRAYAHSYIKVGWAVFMLSTDGHRKLPPADCPRCWRQPKSTHDPEACECLTCHSFYAATTDLDRFDQILAKVPHGHLAIRTGGRSRLLVVDAESHAQEGECSGLETLESWEAAVGGWSLPQTLSARSANGGLHLYLKLPDDVGYVKGGRVLAGVDIKADGGLVGAVSGIGSRAWVDPSVRVAEVPEVMISWLTGGKRSRVGSGGAGGTGGGVGYRRPGYDYQRFLVDGCPDGYRNDFMNDLLFRNRKNGLSVGELLDVARRHWLRFPQPPAARWEMPWHEIVDMAERVFCEVEPDMIPEYGERWLAAGRSLKPQPGEVRKIGNVTMVRRSRSGEL